jgi:hypothetical protein
METEFIKENDNYILIIHINDNQDDNVYVKCEKASIEQMYKNKSIDYESQKNIDFIMKKTKSLYYELKSNLDLLNNLPILLDKNKINDDEYVFNLIIYMVKYCTHEAFEMYYSVYKSLENICYTQHINKKFN